MAGTISPEEAIGLLSSWKESRKTISLLAFARNPEMFVRFLCSVKSVSRERVVFTNETNQVSVGLNGASFCMARPYNIPEYVKHLKPGPNLGENLLTIEFGHFMSSVYLTEIVDIKADASDAIH